MSEQLAYAIITPHSLRKSRTGGIITRLITRTGLELVAARMFAPSAELIKEYAETLTPTHESPGKKHQELLQDFVRNSLSPDPRTGRRRRVMALLFRGDDAVAKIRSVVGDIYPGEARGETIRDTFADLIFDDNGKVRYFEPAVLASPEGEVTAEKLKIWANYSDADGGVLEGINQYPEGVKPERSLVLIKPDNFRFPTGRPGAVIDFFSRTGLTIVGMKMHRMSVAEAMEFYGPVREVLRTRLKGMVGARARKALEKEFGFVIPEACEAPLGDAVGPVFGDDQFSNIVRFMSGRAPEECPESELNEPGSERCIALVYEGVDAVNKIRTVLGPTDPSKAPPGSIRREFGQSIMVNAAHASDSEENAKREMAIVKVEANNFKRIIEEYLG